MFYRNFYRISTLILAVILMANVSLSSAAYVPQFFEAPQPEQVEPKMVTLADWQSEKDDMLRVNVITNMGYLTHPNGDFLEFPLVTGQRRYVYYIGRYYFAGTPVQEWEIRGTEIKYDRVTFGKTGRFLRLYHNGVSTPYGVHPYRYEERMFAEGPRYRSMGCIIVTEEMTDLLEQTLEVNEGSLKVVTVE